VLGALATVVLAAAPALAQNRAAMEFPAPGSRWITRSTDQNGGSRLGTYTVLEPGSFQGTPGFRISDEVDVLFFERTSRNWFATVQRDKERSGASPHQGTFAWPLEVGKRWVSVFEYRDQQRNLRFDRIQTAWRVTAEENVTVPAGTFTAAFRLEGANAGNAWTRWYAPAVRLYAGTPAVVTTLWKVDDRASFVLMREFYDGLAKADTGLALQAAQRAAMKEFPHPYAWAAFGLTGVGR